MVDYLTCEPLIVNTVPCLLTSMYETTPFSLFCRSYYDEVFTTNLPTYFLSYLNSVFVSFFYSSFYSPDEETPTEHDVRTKVLEFSRSLDLYYCRSFLWSWGKECLSEFLGRLSGHFRNPTDYTVSVSFITVLKEKQPIFEK